MPLRCHRCVALPPLPTAPRLSSTTQVSHISIFSPLAIATTTATATATQYNQWHRKPSSQQRRHLHASRPLLLFRRDNDNDNNNNNNSDDDGEVIDRSTNHYETLRLQPGATPTEIKKSFYALSKTHHPDHNRGSDQRASSRRFMRISEAYSVLSSPTKRTVYDRDHGLQGSSSSHRHGRTTSSGGGGSYSSTSSSSPAGGRPASGLSSRRRPSTTFTGPPPSFFRSGGWGSQSSKRRAAHEDSTGGASSASTTQRERESGGGGGMGPGQDPFGHADDEVPHFDRRGHERTGRHVDARRAARQQQQQQQRQRQQYQEEPGIHGGSSRKVDGQHISVEPEEAGPGGMFFVIGGILTMGVLAPFAVSKMWGGGSDERKEKREKKGAG